MLPPQFSLVAELKARLNQNTLTTAFFLPSPDSVCHAPLLEIAYLGEFELIKQLINIDGLLTTAILEQTSLELNPGSNLLWWLCMHQEYELVSLLLDKHLITSAQLPGCPHTTVGQSMPVAQLLEEAGQEALLTRFRDQQLIPAPHPMTALHTTQQPPQPVPMPVMFVVSPIEIESEQQQSRRYCRTSYNRP